VTALLHGLVWNAIEATLLGLVVAVLVQFGRPGAPVRHALWCIVLLRLVLPPLGIHSYGLSALCRALMHDVRASTLNPTLPNSISDGNSIAPPIESGSETDELADLTIRDNAGEVDRLNPHGTVGTELSQSVVVEVSPQSVPTTITNDSHGDYLSAPLSAALWHWLPRQQLELSLLTAWLAGSLCLLVLRIKQCVSILRVAAEGEPAPQDISTACREIAAQLGLNCAPAIRIVDMPLSPTVCAIGRATILLPGKFLEQCGPQVARAVLAHELAHLKRRDHWLCWVELVGSLVYWWHPVYWWARRQVRWAADEAADAWAVWVLGARRRYAESLLQTVELLIADRTVAAAWGPALGARDTLARRLNMIMKGPLCHRLSWPAWLGIGVMGLLILPAAPPPVAAQQPATAPDAAAPTEEEFNSLLDLLDQDQPAQRQQLGQTPQPPAIPRIPQRPAQPQPPAHPERAEGRRDADQRLDELEEKVDRILQMLQGMQAGRPGMGADAPGSGFSGGRFRGFGASVGAGPQPPQTPGSPGMGPSGRGMPGPGARPGGGGPFGRGAPQAPAAPEAGGDAPQAGEPRARRPLGPRGHDLAPEQRERIEAMQRELHAELEKIEAEQARMMEEFNRRRAEIERKHAEIMREFFSREQSERDRGRRDSFRRRPDGELPRDEGDPRPPTDQPRDGQEL
jgi:beta-lactamase regulating signal transducer with metallopeptidase domain